MSSKIIVYHSDPRMLNAYELLFHQSHSYEVLLYCDTLDAMLNDLRLQEAQIAIVGPDANDATRVKAICRKISRSNPCLKIVVDFIFSSELEVFQTLGNPIRSFVCIYTDSPSSITQTLKQVEKKGRSFFVMLNKMPTLKSMIREYEKTIPPLTAKQLKILHTLYHCRCVNKTAEVLGYHRNGIGYQVKKMMEVTASEDMMHLLIKAARHSWFEEDEYAFV